MNRHAKASSAGSTSRQAASIALRVKLFVTAMAALSLSALLPAYASAAQTHPFLETFGSAEQPTFSHVAGIAIDQSTGDVLVAERGEGEGTISRFNPDGTPANFSALGTNVIDGAGPGDATPQGGLVFPERASQIAVDNSGTSTDGNIYVTQPREPSGSVDIFSSTGAYLGSITASSEAPFEPYACGVAVDPTGSVYISEFAGHIHKYQPSGALPSNADNTANFPSPSGSCGLAAGAGPTAGFLFVQSYFGGPVSKIDSSTGEAKYEFGETFAETQISVDPSNGHVYASPGEYVREFDASGSSGAMIVSTTPTPPEARVFAVRASTGNLYVGRLERPTLDVYGPTATVPTVTAEAADSFTINGATLHGTVNPEGVAVSECKFEYGPASGGYPSSVPCEGSIPADSSDHPVLAPVTGLSDGAEYHFRLTAENANGSNTSGSLSFTTLLSLELATQVASGVTGTEATLNGTVNPKGYAVSECKFEYGPTSEASFLYSVPCEGSIPTDTSVHPVSANITGLPGDGSEWRYRLVAANEFGPKTSASEIFTVDTAAVTEPASAVTQGGATLNGTLKTDGKPLTECKFEFGIDSSFGQSAPCVPAAGSIPTDFSAHPVSASIAGLEEGTTYYFRLVTTNAGGTVRAEALSFATPGLPAISGETSISGQSYALLGGYVNPDGAETTYHFEWGPTASYGSSAPAGPEPSAGSGTEPVPVATKLSGLEIGQTYHFRMVATNSYGTSEGPDQTFTTYKSLGLPDSRRYEQVSPVDKNNSDVFPSEGELDNTVRAARDGNGLVFLSPGGFAGATGQFGVGGNPYLARRTASGWTTKFIGPSSGELHFQDAWMSFSEDLSQGILRWAERGKTIDPSAHLGVNVYLLDNASGSAQLLNGTLADNGPEGGFVGASGDYGKIALESAKRLTADAPANCSSEGQIGHCVYEVEGGALRLASVLPDGSAVKGTAGGGVGRGNYEDVVSQDGARVFFATWPTEGGGAIYAREEGVSTTLVSGSERTLPGGISGEPSNYQAAEAAHGDRVIFTTRNSLVNGDTNSTNDLYMYDFTKPAGERLALISEDRDPEAPNGAEVNGADLGRGGLLAHSQDLRRIYFVADNQLVGGAPTRPGPKLYLWDDTGASPQLRYIATLKNNPTIQEGDIYDWGAPAVTETRPSMKSARVSEDGRFVTFISKEKLTPFDNQASGEIYLYDAQTNSLTCASCSPDADPVAGYVTLGRGGSSSPRDHLYWNVSASGRLFFETSRGLLPQDTNGVGDVYEYENGQLHLISAGSGGLSSHFIDASVSGDDVFFTTEDRLVGWDDDENFDAYDARVGGGFPEPPPQPPACEGDSCQSAPVVPNDPTPASSAFEGSGNVREAPKTHRCARGKVRRRGRCLKKRHAHKKQGHGRTATRSHG